MHEAVANHPTIRMAKPTDAAELLAIYAPYVEQTAITFEYTVPTLAEFRNRINDILPSYPYLVAEQDGRLLGFVCLHAFVGRQAYSWAAEISIYLSMEQRGRGLGRRLYQAIEQTAAQQHIYNLNACVACPETEDAYLTRNSMQFHQHMGYKLVGEFHKCGFKFNTWYNMVWLEKLLGTHPTPPEPFIPIAGLAAAGERHA